MNDRIEKQVELRAPVSRIWRALTDFKEFGEWFRVKLEGPFEVGEVAHGTITYPGYQHLRFDARVEKMEHERLFSFTWPHVDLKTGKKHSEDSITLVEFRLKEIPSGTLLVVTESGFDKIPIKQRGEAYRSNEVGWTVQMDNIRKYVSTQIESATSFLQMVADRKVSEAYEKFISKKFIHHNQYFMGDRQSLMAAMEGASKKNPDKTLSIKKVFEDGDTIITLSHVKQNPDDSGGAVVHIFRFEDNRVAELWDFGQQIVKDSPNENGAF